MPGKTGGKESKTMAKGKTPQTGTKGKPPKRKTSDAGSESSSKAPDAVSFEICQSEGNTFRGMGMYKKAVNSYSRALMMKPRHKSVLLARSQCYQQIGDNDLALADANDIVAQDAASVKGLLQKADVFYQMGQFEYSLMLYHRGYKLRPEIQGFRLGIQKSKEAIENSIGENAGIKLEKKGDLSFFIEEQRPPNKRKDANQHHRQSTYQQQHLQQDKKASHNKKRAASDKDKKTVKQLLGELYEDVTYLEGLLSESERTTQTQANAHVTDLASECLDYLDSRAEFWQQQQPTYSREQERRNRTKGQDAATPHQKKDAKKKEDPTKWIIENLEEIDDALDMKEYEECIDRCSRVLKEIEKYSESEVPRKMEFVSDVHSYMGNAYVEMEEYEEATEHHLKDYEVSKNTDQAHGMSRALDNLGRTYAKMGHHKKAIKIFTERLSSQNCTTLEKAWLYHEIGRCHLELEETEKAKNFAERSRESAAEAEDDVWQLNSSILIAQAQLKLKETDLALETFEKALAMAQALEDSAAEQAIRKTINNIKNEMEPRQTTETTESTEAEPNQDTEPKEVPPKQQAESKEPEPKQQTVQKEATPKQQTESKETEPKQTVEKVEPATERVEPTIKGDEPAKIEPKPTNKKDESLKSRKPEDTAKITSYKVTVKISDIANAGTDSDLEVEIFGQKGNTGRQKLTVSETNTRKHDKGQSDTFTLVAKDVGEISKIRVAQTSELPGLGCHIAEISVKSSGSAVPTVFHCYSWFDKAHDDGLTEREFAPAVTASEDIAKDGTAKEKNEQAKNR